MENIIYPVNLCKYTGCIAQKSKNSYIYVVRTNEVKYRKPFPTIELTKAHQIEYCKVNNLVKNIIRDCSEYVEMNVGNVWTKIDRKDIEKVDKANWRIIKGHCDNLYVSTQGIDKTSTRLHNFLMDFEPKSDQTIVRMSVNYQVISGSYGNPPGVREPGNQPIIIFSM